ncbi:MAG TPA: thiolase family protein [Verrucomicrobiae bacterium]|jgi:acetyl-CoA C-acetyltransferase/acetyl-CoA acyltransferase|nr:thiolase family protein [Verrucomicrobiae bacterium]
MNERMVIVDGVRTPFCKMGSDLAPLGADELGRVAVNALLTRTGLAPAIVDEVIFGCVAQPADAANVARVIALRAGIPESVPAITVHRNCASGCEAITQAWEKIVAGRGSVFIVGGAESMSNIPLLFKQTTAEKFGRVARAKTFGQRLKAFAAFRPADFQPRIGLQLGLTDPVCGLNMGETAEVLAREFSISREEQDQFALCSHQRAIAGREKLAAEICPVFSGTTRLGKSAGKHPAVVQDNGPRENQTLEALAKLKPVFDRKTGSVTAGNSSQITDGAVALLVMTEKRAQELGYKPLGVLSGYAYAGCDPSRMGLGPLFAIAKAETKTNFKIADADIIEINEAFAAQTLAVMRGAVSEKFARECLSRDQPLGEILMERLNVNGGAIALGHPVGATGARLVLASLKELQRRNARRALVTLCVGGGQGAALWLERM